VDHDVIGHAGTLRCNKKTRRRKPAAVGARESRDRFAPRTSDGWKIEIAINRFDAASGDTRMSQWDRESSN
jgi:hypothetical protein